MRALFLTCACLLACDAKGTAAQSVSRADQVAHAEPQALTRAALTEQLSALTRQMPANASVLVLEFTPAGARMQTESPAARGSLLQYEWQSRELGRGVPVELRGKGQLAQNLFALSTVDLAALPALLETARARVDAENGRVARVLIRRNLPHDESVGMRVYVDSPRRSGHVDADAHGRVLDPGRYP